MQFLDRLGVSLGQHVAVAKLVLEGEVARVPLDPVLVDLQFLLEILAFQLLLGRGVLGPSDLLPQVAELGVLPLIADVGVAVGDFVGLGQQLFGVLVAVLVEVDLGEFQVVGEVSAVRCWIFCSSSVRG